MIALIINERVMHREKTPLVFSRFLGRLDNSKTIVFWLRNRYAVSICLNLLVVYIKT